ncbi:MAG: hypothetical protein QOG19_2013, partial [Mycobacterium sp.]|nr:hypothetical protein [Mycobacterium sp.]
MPSLLFTAVAATAVILPAALSSGGPSNDAPAVSTPLIVQRPLESIGSGETIRDVHQDTPFSMVALTAGDLTGTSARVRAKRPDGSWGPWYETENLEGVGVDSPGGVKGTEPVFVGRTTDVQIAVHRPAGAAPAATSDPGAAPAATSDPGAKPGLGYVPANVELPLAGNFNAVLISPPTAPADTQWTPPTALIQPGQPPNIISRAQWGADESWKCGDPQYDSGVRAGVVHHTAGSNDYAPQDSAGIVRSIFAYHARTLGWCDIAYNALVDKYGQVFEGRAGGMTRPVESAATGGFNQNTWSVAMLGDFDTVAPTPIQLRTTGRLLGWRLGMDGVDPKGTVAMASEGGPYTHFARGAVATLPSIFTHRDVGITDCPGNAAYAQMDLLRDIAARFNAPLGPEDLLDQLRGGAIFDKWTSIGGNASPLGAPKSPEAAGDGATRYVTFDKGAMYWSTETGAEPVTGAIYDAWAALGFERGVLGLPTSGETQQPQWV